MYRALMVLLVTFSFKSFAATKYIHVLKDIKANSATKTLFIQNNRVVEIQEIDTRLAFCQFENVRGSDRTLAKTLTKGMIFKIDASGFESWEKYLSVRIWQKTGFIWDNGYYQYFSCDALNAEESLTDETLQKHVGKLLKFY